jgi:LacI family transcriptional regulator
MAATMKDISQATGLGLATISKYFNGGNVRERNRVLIEEASRRLHFTPNEVARSLKTHRTRAVGVVIPELNNAFITTYTIPPTNTCNVRVTPGSHSSSIKA